MVFFHWLVWQVMGQGQQVVHPHDLLGHIKIFLNFQLFYSLKFARLIISSSNSLRPTSINAIGFFVASFNSNGRTIRL